MITVNCGVSDRPISIIALRAQSFPPMRSLCSVSLGACGGELACATCHLVFDQELYDTLPEKEEEEDDMLDLAFELTET